MLGTTKPFDKADHNTYDQKGKQAFLNYLNKILPQGFEAIENSNIYGIDIIVLSPSKIVVLACDVEVRYGNWKGNTEFPFSKINCIERKDHLWQKDKEFVDKIPYQIASGCQVYYVQLNDLCTKAVIIQGNDILNQEQVQWENRKMSGEYVRQVPLELTKQVNLWD